METVVEVVRLGFAFCSDLCPAGRGRNDREWHASMKHLIDAFLTQAKEVCESVMRIA
jgi:hypothetical protein